MRPTIDQATDALNSDRNAGFCTSCGEEAHNVEPDARGYKCESCGEFAVSGAEEIVISGQYDDDDEPTPTPTPTPRKTRVPSIQELLTGKRQSDWVKSFAEPLYKHSGFLLHQGILIVKRTPPDPFHAIESYEARKLKQVEDCFGRYGIDKDAADLICGTHVEITDRDCVQMLDRETRKHICTVDDIYRRAAEKHGNAVRWFPSIELFDDSTVMAIIGHNTAGERVAVLACMIDE